MILQKEQLQGGINFYLYKNFNKFIQNLYVKNADQNKLLAKKANKENTADNPYMKEIIGPIIGKIYIIVAIIK